MTAMNDLLQVMNRLRDPDEGCPWDLAQTIDSIAPYTIEEAYEIVEAIESGSMDELCDELGDLLYHIVFYAEMANEAQHFNFDTVCSRVSEKLVRRHPHVFENKRPADTGSLVTEWEAMKRQEREDKARLKGEAGTVLGGIASAMPALIRAEKLQKRAATVGFDWPDIKPVMEKLLEEIEELNRQMSESNDQEAIAEELGDVLFSCVNLARHLDVCPETALRQSNRKFEKRFAHVERQLGEKGSSPMRASLEQMDRLWEEAKQLE